MRFTKKELEAWHTFKNKAPVDLPTSQQAASNALQVIGGYLDIPEARGLSTARWHSVDIGEGRGEFDHICKNIEQAFKKRGFL